MATYCDLAEEVAVLDDANELLFGQAFDDAAVLDDAFSNVIVVELAEAAVLDDAMDDRETYNIAESAILDDAVAYARETVSTIAEVARLSDDVIGQIKQNVTEVAVLDDAIVGIETAHVVEVAILNDAAGGVQTESNSAVEAAVLDDFVSQSARDNFTEEAVLNDAVTQGASGSQNILETAVLDDSMDVPRVQQYLVEESAELGDAFAQVMTGGNDFVEVAYLDDATIGGAHSAWRAHLEPLAMSRYENYPWNSMAVIGGELFGAGPGGVFRLSGSTDDGDPIAASVTHDWLNRVEGKDGPVADNHLKRPRYLYLKEVKANGALALSLGYVRNDGGKDVGEYPLPSTSATGFVNVRVALGRGIRSQHLRPVIRNVDGADFEYGEGELVVDSLVRSI